MATKNHIDQKSAAAPLLYQHKDGRNLVAVPGSEAVAGDPGWQRVGPVEIEHQQPPSAAAAGLCLNRIACLADALRDAAFDLIGEGVGDNRVVQIEAISSQIGWMADLGAELFGEIAVIGTAERWMLPTRLADVAEARYV